VRGAVLYLASRVLCCAVRCRLVKLWSIRRGQLHATLRGQDGEINDLSIRYC